MTEDSPIIVALDYPNAKLANDFLLRIQGQPCKLKVGLELFIAEGPKFVEQLSAKGHQVFLDLKLHDIPNTVASACKSASNLGVWMMTLHALGGATMMRAAYDAMSATPSSQATKLVAVTVLTSIDQQQLNSIGIQQTPSECVMTLAELAIAAKLDGMVCSAHEVAIIRAKWGKQPMLVTPGIRMQNDQANDQSRIASPQQARIFGANYIVVGRPITAASDPIMVMNQYLEDWSSSI
ncbi:MAG: orotidine-5'-phosphate decarboxylase [Gammaproteobacteria bacterium]|nr:MAG: orotidine-5'-phosphate decarboxylase [Gammaproteobacteria bacterium]